MKVVKNKIIPFKGFIAIALWPFIFCRKELSKRDIRHEEIHGKQQIELFWVAFFLLYVLFWIVELFRCAIHKERGQAPSNKKQRNLWHRIGHAIAFEQEAYDNQEVTDYLRKRRWMAWVKYLF